MIHRSRLAKILIVLLAAALFRAAPVLAHAVFVSANPGPNQIVAQSPQELVIRFSEPVAPQFSSIVLFTQSGQQVDVGEVRVANANRTALAVDLPPLSNGTFLVSWQVLSTVDSHSTSGSFPFAVGVSELSAAPGAVTANAQLPTIFTAGARGLNLIGLALVLGLAAFALLVWRPTLTALNLPAGGDAAQRIRRAGLRLGLLGAGLLLAALVTSFAVQAVRFDLFDPARLQGWLATQFGLMWLTRLGLTLVLLAALLFLRKNQTAAGWPWAVVLPAAAGVAVTTSLVSHSAALPFERWLPVTLDLLHLLAAAVWVGGLAQLALALWLARKHIPAELRGWLSLGLTLNFSTLAAGAVGVLLVSGGYLGWKHVGSWPALFGTAYGLTLLVKIGLALPAFAVAGANLFWLKPKLEAAAANPEAPAARSARNHLRLAVRVELASALLVLLAAGLLTDLQRGQEAPLLASQAETLALTESAEGLTVNLALEPALVGQNTFDLTVTDAAGNPLADVSGVELSFAYLGQSVGMSRAQATALGNGRFRLDGSYLSLVGPWQVEAAIQRPGRFDAFVPFRVDAGVSGRIQPIDRQESWLEETVGLLNRNGGPIIGVLLVLFALSWHVMVNRAARRPWQLVPLLLPGVLALWFGVTQLTAFYRDFTPTAFVTNPILPDGASITRGREIFAANCALCHGPEGRGDGELAVGMEPAPADFADGHTAGHTDGDLYFWIKEGVRETAMPAFSSKLTDEEIWHTVNYVRRLSAQGK